MEPALANPLKDESEYAKAKRALSLGGSPKAVEALSGLVREYEFSNPQRQGIIGSTDLGLETGFPQPAVEKRIAERPPEPLSQLEYNPKSQGYEIPEPGDEIVLPDGKRIPTKVKFDKLRSLSGRGNRLPEETRQLAEWRDELATIREQIFPETAHEFEPEGASAWDKLKADTFHEPSVEQFRREMGQHIPGIEKLDKDSVQYQTYADAKASAARDWAVQNNKPWYRPNKKDGPWSKANLLQEFNATNETLAPEFLSGATAGLAEVPIAAADPELAQRYRERAEQNPIRSGVAKFAGSIMGAPTLLAKGAAGLVGKAVPAAASKAAPFLTGVATDAAAGGLAVAGEERIRDLSQAAAEEIGDFGDGTEGIAPLSSDAKNFGLGSLGGLGFGMLGRGAGKSAEDYLASSNGNALYNARQAGVTQGRLGGVREPEKLKELRRDRIQTGSPTTSVEQHIVERVKGPIAQAELDADEALKMRLGAEKESYAVRHDKDLVSTAPMVDHALDSLRNRTNQATGESEAFVNDARVFSDNIDRLATFRPAVTRADAQRLIEAHGGGRIMTERELELAGIDPPPRTGIDQRNRQGGGRYVAVLPNKVTPRELERLVDRIDDQAGFARQRSEPDKLWLEWAQKVRDVRDKLPADPDVAPGGYSALMGEHDDALREVVQRRERGGLPAKLGRRAVGSDPTALEPDLKTSQQVDHEKRLGGYGATGTPAKSDEAMRELASQASPDIRGELEMLKAARWADTLRQGQNEISGTNKVAIAKGLVNAGRQRVQPALEAMGSLPEVSPTMRAFLRGLRGQSAEVNNPYRAASPRMGGLSLIGGVPAARGAAAASDPGESDGDRLSAEDMENLTRLLSALPDTRTQ